MVTKKNLSEEDASAKFITPALYQSGWAEAAIRRQDVLYIGHFPIALIEAKHNFKAMGDGMQQALDYATTLDAFPSPTMTTAAPKSRATTSATRSTRR